MDIWQLVKRSMNIICGSRKWRGDNTPVRAVKGDCSLQDILIYFRINRLDSTSPYITAVSIALVISEL